MSRRDQSEYVLLQAPLQLHTIWLCGDLKGMVRVFFAPS